MPNHITNVLRISAYSFEDAPVGYIDDILAAVRSDESPFDFERLVPMPPELKITSGSVTSNAIALVSDHEAKAMLSYPWVADAGVRTIAALRTWLRTRYIDHPEPGYATLDDFLKRVLENKEKHGATDWYQWCIKHWGTKWNAYSVVAGKTDDREATIHFETAWSPPLPVLDELSKLYPKADLRLLWCDEGDDKQHRAYWSHGKRDDEEE